MDIFGIIYNILCVNVNEIIPNIWLGNSYSAHDKKFLIDKRIDVIVNCTTNVPFINDMQTIDISSENVYKDIITQNLELLPKFENIRIPVEDSLLEKDILLMQHYLVILLPKLLELYTSGKRILIHCYAGKQRSAIVVAALLYTLRYTQETDKQALSNEIFKFIISRRPQAFTYGLRINFLKTFNRLFEIK